MELNENGFKKIPVIYILHKNNSWKQLGNFQIPSFDTCLSKNLVETERVNIRENERKQSKRSI